MGPQLVGRGDPVGDQVSAGTHAAAQRGGLLAVVDHGPQPSHVGTDHVGQDVGVEPVVLVPGRSVPAAQVLHLPRRDHEDHQPGLHQGVDDGAVAAFDADLFDPGTQQPGGHPLQPGRVVRHGEPVQDLPLIADHADHVVVLGPVHPRRDAQGSGVGVDTHSCLLAVASVGRHPVVPGHRSRSLTDRRSLAHSPVASRGVLGRRASQNSCWTSKVERQWRWPGGDQRCTRTLPLKDQTGDSDTRMVHQ